MSVSSSIAALIVLVCSSSVAQAFCPCQTPRTGGEPVATRLWAEKKKKKIRISGQGFGDPKSAPEKTYGKEASTPIADVIDIEEAMQEFFTTRANWRPLFRQLSSSSSSSENQKNDNEKASLPTKNCPATRFLRDLDEQQQQDEAADWEFSESSTPWRRLPAIPVQDDHKAFLDTFLDEVHKSLLNIPVTNSKNGAEDDNDVQFLEEGRRMLAVNRFHVIFNHGEKEYNNKNKDDETSRLSRYDRLFAACWSELLELATAGDTHTGSLILLPDADLSDMRRFCDMNIRRPLEWLGLRNDFEVAAMERGSSAIRLLYKLDTLPDIPDDESAYANPLSKDE